MTDWIEFREMPMEYIGKNKHGQRQYRVQDTDGPVTVTALNEDEWTYGCDKCPVATEDCEHIMNVKYHRDQFERADEQLGRGYF